MGRRTILLVVALVIALLGSGMVFLYVQGADRRAEQDQAPVEVLQAVAQIEQGETMAEAQQAGKLAVAKVPASQKLDDAVGNVTGMESLVALQTIFPREQIISSKFGAEGTTERLPLPKGAVAISVNLSDTGRVAGFVSPGSKVALFFNGPVNANGDDGVRLLLSDVEVVAVAQTTITPAAPTDGTAPAEALPLSLFTLALQQPDVEKVLYASTHGELSFALLNADSQIKATAPITINNLFGKTR